MTCNWKFVLDSCWSACDEYPAMMRRQRKTRGRRKQKAGRASGGMDERRHGSTWVLWIRASANHHWVPGTHQERERSHKRTRACSRAARRVTALPSRLELGNRSLGTPGTSTATLVLRNSSPRAFQRYLTHLLTPRGSPFTSYPLVRSTLTVERAV